ncbi:unnamed protein product, partial [Closterium sp. NIES-53]
RGRLGGGSRCVASSASSPEATISGSPASLLRQSPVGPLLLPLRVSRGASYSSSPEATISGSHSARRSCCPLFCFACCVDSTPLWLRGRLTAPLTDLLRKGVAFMWGEKEHAAFSALKNVLCSPPVLRIADPHRPFEVITDASDIAIRAILLQDLGNALQPIAYE